MACWLPEEPGPRLPGAPVAACGLAASRLMVEKRSTGRPKHILDCSGCALGGVPPKPNTRAPSVPRTPPEPWRARHFFGSQIFFTS